MKILEIGCGNGRLLIPMSNIFGSVYGVDVSNKMINECSINVKEISNCKIQKNVFIKGNCSIANNTTISKGTIITNSSIGTNVIIEENCHIHDSVIGDNTHILPNIKTHNTNGQDTIKIHSNGKIFDSKKAKLGAFISANSKVDKHLESGECYCKLKTPN